jgi:hypothetical protein
MQKANHDSLEFLRTTIVLLVRMARKKPVALQLDNTAANRDSHRLGAIGGA